MSGPESRLRCPLSLGHGREMPLPSQPVTLTAEQLADLNRKLSAMRHDINNQLSLIIAAAELIRHKPQTAERMMATLVEQPPKIADALLKFSTEFERALASPATSQIPRPGAGLFPLSCGGGRRSNTGNRARAWRRPARA